MFAELDSWNNRSEKNKLNRLKSCEAAKRESVTVREKMQAVEEEKKTKIAVAFDKADEDQIVAEIRGEIVEPYFYKFEKSGKEVTGLSYSGVRYIAKKMAESGENPKITSFCFKRRCSRVIHYQQGNFKEYIQSSA